MGFITDLLRPHGTPVGSVDRHLVAVDETTAASAARGDARARRRPIGQFRDCAPSPQDPTHAIVGELLDSMMDQPGIRLAGATGRRIFFAGSLTPQKFTTPPHAVNDDANVRAGMIQMNTRRTITRSKAAVERFGERG